MRMLCGLIVARSVNSCLAWPDLFQPNPVTNFIILKGINKKHKSHIIICHLAAFMLYMAESKFR